MSTRKRKEARPREVLCKICGKTFTTTHSQGKYCSNKCRNEANRYSWRKYNENNREKRRKCTLNCRHKYKEKYDLMARKYKNSLKGKENIKKHDLRMKELYPEKYKARILVGHAVKNGTLIKKPCEICGELKVQAHHIDYSKPLDVIWLCDKHHRQLHREIKILGSDK